MTSELQDRLAGMREAILYAHPSEKVVCELAGKLLTAHADKPTATGFYDEFLSQVAGATIEQRAVFISMAYEMLDGEGYMVQAPGQHHSVLIEGKRQMRVSGYMLSAECKRFLDL